MKLHLITALLGLSLTFPALAGTDWETQPDDSHLSFSGTQQGSRFDGRFPQFEARIRFDPGALDDSHFDVSIDVTGIDTDNSERDEAMADRAWFDFRRHPQAHFQATEFIHVDGNRYRANAELEIRGKRQPVVFSFEWESDGDSAQLRGEAELNRLDFDLGLGDWSDADMIGHQVKVRTQLQLQRSPAP